MRGGDFSASPLAIFDPLTGDAAGASRTPFAGNRLPTARLSPIIGKITNLIPAPNIGTAGAITQNYFNSGSFIYDRHTLDTKVNAQLTNKLNVAGRVSYLDWHFDNPALFGPLGGNGLDARGSYDGLGLGTTLSMTYSAIYTLSPTVVLDGYAGYTLLDNGVENIRLDENLGRDFLGIPGTNGSSRVEGGWPGFNVAGFDAYGRAQTNSPWNLNLPQAQYVAAATVSRGKHSLRFGWDALFVGQNGNEPYGSPGFFNFTQGTTGQVGTATNNYNSFAAFVLGLPNNTQRTVRRETGQTRTWAHSLYLRDKWQPTQKLTVSMGLRWDYFAPPTRVDGRGLEIFDFNTGNLRLCGVGNQPTNCGFQSSKRYFSPRLGIAYRATPGMVIRAGFGITWDPVNIGRNPLQTYPIISSASFPAANGFQFVAPIAQGIPAVAPPTVGNGEIKIPGNIALELADPNFRRSYIQAWNLMVERELPGGWTGQAGYVGNRSLRLQNRWNANYGTIGGGTAGLVLNRRIGYTAGVNIFSDAGGFRGYYDSLQASVQRRMTRGVTLRFTYTWSKAQGPWSGNDFGVDGYNIITPDYWGIAAKGVKSYDRTQNFNASFSAELPFGAGKGMATSGVPAALLGGWQFNGLYTAYTGGPFTVTSSAASLNAPGNSQIADQIKGSVETFGNVDRWFDISAYAPVTAARFGNSGWNQLRGPGMHNVDLSIYRSFKVTESVGVQFRAEMFNISNTPHFANPSGDSNGANFGRITSLANTGRDGIDERFVRFGLRLSF
jgi:TonB dependent receptor